jgi:hypothetical protein
MAFLISVYDDSLNHGLHAKKRYKYDCKFNAVGSIVQVPVKFSSVYSYIFHSINIIYGMTSFHNEEID